MSLLIYPAIDKTRLEAIRAAAGGYPVVNAATETGALAAIPAAEAFFGKITPSLLARAGKLRWVQSATASLEHYIFPELVEHPCTLTNMRGLYSDVIAEHVFAYILTFSRNLHIYLRQQREHRYEPVGGEAARSDFASGPGVESAIDRAHKHLTGSTMGIVGLGGIGTEVAARARAFGMQVIAVDPINADAWPLERLHELLAQSDWVVIAAPHTPLTCGLFDQPTIRQMRPSAYLINIGRGAIVKLDALTKCLQEKAIAGAALDVFETEPLPADHPLWDMENVILTPHIAGNCTLIAARHLSVVTENLRRFLCGEPLRNVVRKTDWF
ncbi:MAG: D-2-hydroxyacid dehydrogenase [Bryobacterales bacterium]|nr:D-2-hydroxyacid dehydrogenase [Bryobacterales bacterium]